MFQIESDKIRELERQLQTFARRAVPFATRQTINDSAFAAQKIARADIPRKMITRNKFTVRSVLVNRAKTLVVARQEAGVGSTLGYMEKQEFGGTESSTGKHGLRIATSYSSGEGKNAQPRLKLPTRRNKIRNIRLKRTRAPGADRAQRVQATIRGAAKTGRKYIYLNLERSKGIFRVEGSRQYPKIKMVHSLTHRSVTIPATPWLRPAFDEASRMLPAFYADALRFQLRRRGLFKD